MRQIENDNKLHVLHFMLQGIQLGLDLNTVKKVVPLTSIEKLPKSLDYVVGVMNLAGKSVPVIDLALRLDLKRKNEYSLNTPIILCQEEMYETGIVVDEILGIEIVEKDLLQKNKNVLDINSPVVGVIDINGNLILMLDTSKIVDKNISINNNTIMNKIIQGE